MRSYCSPPAAVSRDFSSGLHARDPDLLVDGVQGVDGEEPGVVLVSLGGGRGGEEGVRGRTGEERVMVEGVDDEEWGAVLVSLTGPGRGRGGFGRKRDSQIGGGEAANKVKGQLCVSHGPAQGHERQEEGVC